MHSEQCSLCLSSEWWHGLRKKPRPLLWETSVGACIKCLVEGTEPDYSWREQVITVEGASCPRPLSAYTPAFLLSQGSCGGQRAWTGAGTSQPEPLVGSLQAGAVLSAFSALRQPHGASSRPMILSELSFKKKLLKLHLLGIQKKWS